MNSRIDVVFISLCGFICFFLWSNIYAEETFRSELHANIEHIDSSKDVRSTIDTVGTTLYLWPVKEMQGPFREAEFLGRNAYIGLDIGKVDTEFEKGLNCDGHLYGFGLTYNRANIPLYASILYDKTTLNYNDQLSSRYNDKTYEIKLGFFPQSDILLALEYSHDQIDIHNFYFKNDLSCNELGMSGKWVMIISTDKALVFDGRFALRHFDENDDTSYENRNNSGLNKIFGLGCDYYFTRKFGLGGGVLVDRGEDKRIAGNSFYLHTSIFPSSSLGIGISYKKYLASAQDTQDNEMYELGMFYRF
jgi:hypothetical protein